MAAQNVHVVPARNGGWTVTEEGAGGAGADYPTQEAAIEAGTAKAKQVRVELLVHGMDGQIRLRNSFGHDPRDVKG
ncbi:DUF2188 domain-containing protein (plasmid) [Cupriavidus sp. P-10]|uniref:DUF2188 domain-containing protein n=1 Tax=Cupriavidus sp. P-10 TaxID=2027911 RepID=UPI000E2F4A90|nr:DUF2188 domain-containing protein [Cupriavidus sp. P-10]BDB29507.1 DUF2188 domain-containing protein [Cupriavidus sp. P-10]